VERVGGKKAVVLNIRVVATSNRDIADAVAQGLFREDLFYRLNVFPLLIPALRQRVLDIVPLARLFLAAHGARAGRPGLRLCVSAEAALQRHAWPGNVRELENIIQRAVILAPGDIVEVDALHLAVEPRRDPAAGQRPSPPTAASATTGPARARQTDELRDVEREHILETLAAAGGSRKLAGQRLGLPERTLRYKLRQYRLAGFLDG
jgi:two-component system response regulator FlrC